MSAQDRRATASDDLQPAPTTIARAIRDVEAAAGDPHTRAELPLEIFLLVSRLVPLFTVDLLVRDTAGRTLLTWRDDSYFGAGWHVPGGAVRFKETIAQRIHACAAEELGAQVTFDPTPLTVEEEIDPVHVTRGHNIALLYRCSLIAGPDPAREARPGRPLPGQWAWHARCPEDMLPVHHRYAPLLSAQP